MLFATANFAISAHGDEAAQGKEKTAKEAGVSLLADGAEKLWVGYGKKEWPKGWKLADGVLHRAGRGGDLRTVNQYGDFDLRFEWKVAPGANSGVIYRVSDETKRPHETGPEYQILDDAKHGDGKNPLTAASSLYGVYAPSKKTAKPPGQWNRSRIVVQGDRVRHFLNGEKVVDAKIGSDDWNRRVAASKFAQWEGYAKSPRGYIVLQDHGDEVWYRGMRIRERGSSAKVELKSTSGQ
jgi:hypothetical protein